MNSSAKMGDRRYSSAKCIYHEGMNSDSLNVDDETLANVAGVVANLNEKIHLLRKEVLELRDFGSISLIPRPSVPNENSSPLGLLPPKKRRNARNLGRKCIKKISSLSIFERKLQKSDCNLCTGDWKLPASDNRKGDESFPLKLEAQNGKGRVYVAGVQNRSRSASPFRAENESKSKKRRPVVVAAGEAIPENGTIVRRNAESRRTAVVKTAVIKRGQKRVVEKTEHDKNYDTGVSNAGINNFGNCSFEENSCAGKGEERKTRPRKLRKSMQTESISKSNKRLKMKCYTKRVRKRVSRGVQTLPKKKFSCRIRSEIVNLFKWRSKEIRQTRRVSGNSEKDTNSGENNTEVIYEPHINSDRIDRVPNNYTPRGEITNSVTYYCEELKENPTGPGTGKYSTRKNYNTKYGFNVDGTNVDVSRTGTRMTENNDKVFEELEKSSVVNLRKKQTKLEKKIRSGTAENAGKTIFANKRSSLRPDGENSNRKSNAPKARKRIKQKNNSMGKSEATRDGEKSLEMANNVDRDDLTQEGVTAYNDEPVIVADERPAKREESENSNRGKRNLSNFKLFTNSMRRSFTKKRLFGKEYTERRGEEDQGNKPVSERLDKRKSDIVDVKKRLDACINDLNDIIFNLSTLFWEIPALEGPAGEGNGQFLRKG